MKLVCLIDNVTLFEILNRVIYTTSNTDLKILNEKFELLDRKDIEVFYMKRIYNNVFAETKEINSNRNICNVTRGGEFVLNGYLMRSLNDDGFVYILDNNRVLVKFNCDLTEKISEFSVGRFPSTIRKDVYTRIIGSILTSYNLSTNEPIWHYSFNQLLEGKEIEQVGDILIYDSSLFISLRDNREVSTKATFVLNVNSGEIIRKYHGFSGQLIRDIDYLYVASRYNVERACLNTHEIVSYDLEEVLKPLGLQIHWSSSIVKNDMLYFVDGGWAKTNRMGIIDLENQKLVWHYDFKIDDVINMNIVKIELNENNLYVQCSDDTLHIFEKE